MDHMRISGTEPSSVKQLYEWAEMNFLGSVDFTVWSEFLIIIFMFKILIIQFKG